MEFLTEQASRVANVSDALDGAGLEDTHLVWDQAKILFLAGEHSFLQAFEEALKEIQ